MPVGLAAAAVVGFVLYSLNFLYFFVDDEGIAFVFAQHLLDGAGLAYNSFEGRVEGYTDLLHVLISAGELAVLRAIGADKINLFFVGKFVSLAAGAATVWVAFTAMRRLRVRPPGAAAGLAFIALAPPLATWSCSSLEMASVGFLTIVLVTALLIGTPRGDRLALLAAVLLILLRLDGFVPAGAVVGSVLLRCGPERRREIARTIVMPLVLVFAAYHAWRFWYFGDWLTGPIYSKILYKFRRHDGMVVYDPQTSYGYRFLTTYGLPIAVPAIVTLAVAAWRVRAARPFVLSAAAMGVYAAAVSDWMAGFRFFIPMLPVLAVAIAVAVSSIARPAVFRATAALLVAWFAWTAGTYAVDYHRNEFGGSWWLTRSFDRDRYFGPHYQLYLQTRDWIRPGTRTAFNQAGFAPFMLDVDNIDDLGLCTRFVATMPTTDVIFTEPGRFSPLTNAPALRAAHAYLLYREPAYIFTRMDTLIRQNGLQVPHEILGGRYRVRLIDAPRQNVVYARTDVPLGPYKYDPNAFLENLAHTSRLRQATLQVERIAPSRYVDDLSFLAGGWRDLAFDQRLHISTQFADDDLPVHELFVGRVFARSRMTLVLALQRLTGATAHRTDIDMAAGTDREIFVQLAEPVRAGRLVIDVINLDAASTSVRLLDVRVQGQTPALATHVRRLSFPAPISSPLRRHVIAAGRGARRHVRYTRPAAPRAPRPPPASDESRREGNTGFAAPAGSRSDGWRRTAPPPHRAPHGASPRRRPDGVERARRVAGDGAPAGTAVLLRAHGRTVP